MSLHVSSYLTIDQIPAECIEDCSRPGPADAAVFKWRRDLGFTVSRDAAIECIASTGAWDRDDLAEKDDDDIAEIILWMACGDFNEWDGTEDSPCGTDVFTLN